MEKVKSLKINIQLYTLLLCSSLFVPSSLLCWFPFFFLVLIWFSIFCSSIWLIRPCRNRNGQNADFEGHRRIDNSVLCETQQWIICHFWDRRLNHSFTISRSIIANSSFDYTGIGIAIGSCDLYFSSLSLSLLPFSLSSSISSTHNIVCVAQSLDT